MLNYKKFLLIQMKKKLFKIKNFLKIFFFKLYKNKQNKIINNIFDKWLNFKD